MAEQSAWAAANHQNNLTKRIGQTKPFCVGIPAVHSPAHPQHSTLEYSGTQRCDVWTSSVEWGDGRLGQRGDNRRHTRQRFSKFCYVRAASLRHIRAAAAFTTSEGGDFANDRPG